MNLMKDEKWKLEKNDYKKLKGADKEKKML